MKLTSISIFTITATVLLVAMPLKTYALDYTISFTGTGSSTIIDNVVVQNLTKGTMVTVPSNNVLNLSDITTSVDQVADNINGIRIYPNPLQDKSTISFSVKQSVLAKINVFSLEGRKLVELNRSLTQGINSFEICLPQGVYTLSVQGNGLSYNTKVISQVSSVMKSQITFLSNVSQFESKSQRSKSGVTKMLYSAGDQLLFKGIFGNYSTIVTDVPTTSKNINFDFMACTDADNNNYAVVKIGTQTWMAECLKTTHYRNGNPISYVTDNYEWTSTNTGACCWYDNEIANKDVFGALYNGYAIKDSRNVAPLGWHVPSKEEWATLVNYLGGEIIAGGKMKENGTTHWISPNTGATNETGFGAIPGGYRNKNTGAFQYKGLTGYFSTCTEELASGYDNAWFYGMFNVDANARNSFTAKNMGFSVRCIKD